MSQRLKEVSWREFADAGLFWWVNRGLHLFGWVLVRIENDDGTIDRVYPARTTMRGFTEEGEAEGFRRLSDHILTDPYPPPSKKSGEVNE